MQSLRMHCPEILRYVLASNSVTYRKNITASNIFFLQVVYAVLHRQEVFEPFKNHPRFNELLENIYTVCVTVYLS